MTFTYVTGFMMEILQPNRPFLKLIDYEIDYFGNNQWDVNEVETLLILVANAGDQPTDYAYLEMYDASHPDIGTTLDWAENTTSMNLGENWMSAVTVHMPDTFEGGIVDLSFIVYYNSSTEDFLTEFIITLEIIPLQPNLEVPAAYYDDYVYGDGDGIVEANETVLITVDLKNTGTGTAFEVEGMIISSSTDVKHEQPYGQWNDIAVNDTESQTVEFEISIRPEALNQTIEFTVYVICENFAGEKQSFEFTITLEITAIPEPELGFIDWIGYEVYGNGDGVADPGEIILIYVGVENYGGYATGIKLNVTTNAELDIYNSTSIYPNLPTGAYSYGEGFLFTIPYNFEGGIVQMNLNASAESAAGMRIEKFGYLELNIGTGDITDPSLTATNYPTDAEVGETLLFTATAEDTATVGLISGVEGVYLAIWNASDPEEAELVILEMNYESGEYSVSSTMSDDPNGMVFAIIVFDEAGNMDYYAGASEEGEVVVQSGSVPELSFKLSMTVFVGVFNIIHITKKRGRKL